MSRPTENPQRSAASTLLWPFTLPYGIAARFKNYAYDRRWLQSAKTILAGDQRRQSFRRRQRKNSAWCCCLQICCRSAAGTSTF